VVFKLEKSEAISNGKIEKRVKENLSFPCFRCGICCTGYQVYMNRTEAESLAKNLGITMQAFIDNYIDPRWPGTESVVVRHVAGRCPFLDQPEGSIFGLCRIHTFKPFCCRQWQASPDRKECRQGLNRYWGLAVNEQGELVGSPEDKLCFQIYVESLSKEEVP
jgi:Fe-S-cluster containining protein